MVPALLDWFWDWPPMQVLQAATDAARERLALDPVIAVAILLGLALLIVWLLGRPPSTREGKLPGESYLGRLTPKSLEGMMRDKPRKRLRSRAQMEREIRRAAERRRAAEKRSGESDRD